MSPCGQLIRLACGANYMRGHIQSVAPHTDGMPHCSLAVCNTHGPHAPVLFTDVPSDGSGHRLSRMLAGLVVAAASGYNYGGALTRVDTTRFFGDTHGVSFGAVLDGFFGGRQVVRCGCCHKTSLRKNPLCVNSTPIGSCPRFHVEFSNSAKSLDELRLAAPRLAQAGEAPLFVHAALPERWVAHHQATRRRRLGHSARTLLEPSSGNRSTSGHARLFSPTLLALLRAPLWARPLRFEQAARPALAMHVRRGDLTAGSRQASER